MFQHTAAQTYPSQTVLCPWLPCTKRSTHNALTFIHSQFVQTTEMGHLPKELFYLQMIVSDTIIKCAHLRSYMWLLIMLSGIFSTYTLSPCVKVSFIRSKYNSLPQMLVWDVDTVRFPTYALLVMKVLI